MLRLAWLLAPIYCKCIVDVLNIWGRGSVTGPWITGDCCWVTVCGFTQPCWMRPAISLANRPRGTHSWLVCHCRHQPSVFVSCHFFPHFLFDWLRLHMCWLFSVFWWLWVFHLRLSILLIWLLLLPQTPIGLWHFLNQIFQLWNMQDHCFITNFIFLYFHSLFLWAIWTCCNMQLLEQRLEFIHSVLCRDFLLLLFYTKWPEKPPRPSGT